MENLCCSPLSPHHGPPLLPTNSIGFFSVEWGLPSGWAFLEVGCRTLHLALSKEQWPPMTARR